MSVVARTPTNVQTRAMLAKTMTISHTRSPTSPTRNKTETLKWRMARVPIQRPSSTAGDILNGRMEVAHVRSQSGGYHHFPSAVARQLQRHVTQRLIETSDRIDLIPPMTQGAAELPNIRTSDV